MLLYTWPSKKVDFYRDTTTRPIPSFCVSGFDPYTKPYEPEVQVADLYTLGFDVVWGNLINSIQSITKLNSYGYYITTSGQATFTVHYNLRDFLAPYMTLIPPRDAFTFLGKEHRIIPASEENKRHPAWWTALPLVGEGVNDLWNWDEGPSKSWPYVIRFTINLVAYNPRMGNLSFTTLATYNEDLMVDPWELVEDVWQSSFWTLPRASYRVSWQDLGWPSGAPTAPVRTGLSCYYVLSKVSILARQNKVRAMTDYLTIATFDWGIKKGARFSKVDQQIFYNNGYSVWTYYDWHNYSYEQCATPNLCYLSCNTYAENSSLVHTDVDSVSGYGVSFPKKLTDYGGNVILNGARDYAINYLQVKIWCYGYSEITVGDERTDDDIAQGAGSSTLNGTITLGTPNIQLWTPALNDTSGIVVQNGRPFAVIKNDSYSKSYFYKNTKYVPAISAYSSRDYVQFLTERAIIE